jgi:hypothetical protein
MLPLKRLDGTTGISAPAAKKNGWHKGQPFLSSTEVDYVPTPV